MEIKRSRAVSNMIGYALLFGLITVTVATTSFAGGPAIQEAQQVSSDGVTADTMEVLTSDIEALQTTEASSRSVQVHPQGGHIEPVQPTTLTIETADGSQYTQVTRPLAYESDSGKEIVYEAGALITRTPAGDSFMTQSPSVSVDDTVSAPLVITTVPRDRSIQSTRGSITATQMTQATAPLPDTTSQLTISISSRYAAAWESYFNRLTVSSFRITTARPSPSTLIVTIERADDTQFPISVPVTEVSLSVTSSPA